MESLFDSGDSHNIASVGATELSSKAVQAVWRWKSSMVKLEV